MTRRVVNYSCFIILFYLFIFRDFIQTRVPVFGYFDELVAAFAIVVFFIRLGKRNFVLRKNSFIPTRLFIFLCIIGFGGALIYRIQPLSAALGDAYLFLKFWLSLYLGYTLFEAEFIQAKGKKIGYHVLFITTLYFALYLTDNFITDIFPSTLRHGFKSTQLFYTHPTTFASNCVFLIALSLFIKDKFGAWKTCGLIQLFLLCTTFRSKAIATAMAIVLVYYFVCIRKKKITIRTLLLFVPIVVAIAWEQIEFYFFSSIQSDSARYQLTRISFEIAKDYFPFGAGFGTFASTYSIKPYSSLYSIYGISNVNGLREGAANFVSDNFWPMVIGQFGLFGFILMGLIIFYLFKSIQLVRNHSIFGYISALSIFVYLMICSTAESAFVHPNSISLAVLLGCILGFIKKEG